jgi:thiosulfate dehydrogenase
MKNHACLVLAHLNAIVAAGFGMSADAAAADAAPVNLTEWAPPDIKTVGDDALGKLVRYGFALVTDTANQIGPDVEDPTKRYAGNNLDCGNCHLKAGTQPYAMPLTGVWGQFPQYRGREGEVTTLEVRINGCMERSLNGRALPLESREMKAFLVYSKWVSTGIPDGAKLVGSGSLSIKDPDRAADVRHGAEVYSQSCAACHGREGQGLKAARGNGYQFPPLWGADSYNNGAGMSRLLTAAAFVRHNMPFGTTYAAPMLSDGDAYDVAAFMNSGARPQKANLEKDYPNRLQKPVDTAYGPYADDFTPAQHKFGPYEPIRAQIKDLAARSAQR